MSGSKEQEHDFSVHRISYKETIPFIMGIHYARRMPCIQYAFGLFDGAILCGVCTFGQPASPWLCKGLAGEENRHNVLELNRLCLLPEYNGSNASSFLVSHSLKELPAGTFVVSYADWGGVASHRLCIPGHQLAIYRHDKSSHRQVFRKWALQALRRRRDETPT